MPRLRHITGKKTPVRSSHKKSPLRARRKPAARKPGARRAASRASILRSLRRAAEHRRAVRPHQLERHEGNPIVEPRENVFWEMRATFNPGAVYADKRIHLLYRAIGGDDVSVLGYASSSDGITIDERLPEPAYAPAQHKKPDDVKPAGTPDALPQYCSGGGWNGGCEDPRLTRIEDRVYLMYTAFDGWGSIRIALTSIDLGDFLKKKWVWEKPTLISPPGEIHKNWVLFPEKINGKFAVLHSISPDILVDYFETVDELKPDEAFIRSRYHRASRTGEWDSWIRGAGPPPIKTDLGWLLFYHAMDIRDPDRYKLGAMILDLNDPTKILYRSRMPILEPEAYYENSGYKSGVVYSCGAVVKDGQLFVYYGGADTVVCVAMANIGTFLDELKKYGTPRLEPQTSTKRSTRNDSR